ncbi:MAG: IS110 family transposase [Candidatus Omnitrophota bacterium]|jgi:transposase
MGRMIGVDLHKNSFTICSYKSEDDYKLKTHRVSPKGIEAFKASLTRYDELAVESTGNTAFFVREVESKVKRIRIVNPIQFKVISSSVKKTDEADALTIARFLSKDMIPEVRMRTKEQSQIASLIGTRDKFVKLRTALKNKIHNILNANGIVTKPEMFTSEKGFEKIAAIELESSYRFEVDLIVGQIRNLNEAVDKINDELKARGQNIDGHKNLTSIKGISDIGATIFLNTIGDINDFKSDKQLAAYFGIVPRVYVSNNTAHYGRITKMGNKIARTALVQSTLVAIRYSPYLRRFYDKLKTKKGSGKAIIATSRKMLGIIYNTLKNNWIFEDFTQFKLVGCV